MLHPRTTRFITLLVITAAALPTGCAMTEIDTPIGTYRSSRDASLDELTIVIDRDADGSERTEVMVGAAQGAASPVIDAQREFLRAFFEAAFQSGMRAAGPR